MSNLNVIGIVEVYHTTILVRKEVLRDGRSSVLRVGSSSTSRCGDWTSGDIPRYLGLRYRFSRSQIGRHSYLRRLWKLADKVAAAGYFVVVPDYFYGDPFDLGNGENLMARVEDWIKNHGQDKGFEDSTKVIEVLKSRGISAIGAAGFCWGGKVVVELAKGEVLKAGVLLHPSRVTVDDIKAVKAPLAILGAEIDQNTTPELVQQFGEILSAKPEVDSFVKIYPGVVHGWAVRYSENDEVAVKNAEEAHVQMLEWLNKYLN